MVVRMLSTILFINLLLLMNSISYFYSFQPQKHKLHQTDVQKEAGLVWRELCAHSLPELNNERELQASQWTSHWLRVQTK